MTLEDAIKAIEELNRDGKVQGFNWNDWNQAEELLRNAGQVAMADQARYEVMWAYHKEEYDADLL
jgi:hypothetical protein